MDKEVSFVDFKSPHIDTTDTDIQESQLPENQLVVWLYKITGEDDDNLSFISKSKSYLYLDENTLSISNYLSCIFAGQIHLLQSPTTFHITFIGQVKIVLNGKICFNEIATESTTMTFEFTFTNNTPIDFLCKYKTFKEYSLLSLVCSSDKGINYKPTFSFNDTNEYFKFDSILDPFGETLSVNGKVIVNQQLQAPHIKTSILTSLVDDDEENNNEKSSITLDNSLGTIIQGKNITLGEIVVCKNVASHQKDIQFAINGENVMQLTEDQIHFYTPVILDSTFNIEKLQIGKSKVFHQPELEYPELGILNIIGKQDSISQAPNLNIFIDHNHQPVFQINVQDKHYKSLNFDCYFDGKGLTSVDDTNFQMIKKDHTFSWVCNENEILKTDLFDGQVFFNHCVNLDKGVKIESGGIFWNLGKLNIWNVNVKKDNDTTTKFVVSTGDLHEILEVDNNSVLTVKQINTTSIDIKDCLSIVPGPECKFNLNLDLKTNGTVYVSNTSDTDSIYTSGGVYITKNLHVNKGISTRRINVKSQTPCIILDSTDNSAKSVPLLGSEGIGTKLILEKSVYSDETDVAIGLSNDGLWYSCPKATSDFNHSWYFGKTRVMSLDGIGNFVIDGKFGGNGIVFNGLKDGILLNGISGKSSSINLNKQVILSQYERTFSINDYLNINDSDCVIKSLNTRVESLFSNTVSSSIIQFNENTFSENNLQFQTKKIIEWGPDFLSLNNDDSINIASKYCTVYTGNQFKVVVDDKIVTTFDAKSVYFYNPINVGLIKTEKITTTDLVASNLISDSIVSSKVMCKDLNIEYIKSTHETLMIEPNVQLNNVSCNQIECEKLIVKNIEYGNVKSIFVENNQDSIKFYYIGQLNTTDSGFGLDENGSIKINVTTFQEDFTSVLTIYYLIRHGKITSKLSTESTESTESNPQTTSRLYNDNNGNHHIFICIPPFSSVSIGTVGKIKVSECDEGNEIKPNGKQSKFNNTWYITHDTHDTHDTTQQGIVDFKMGRVDCQNALVQGDILIQGNTIVQANTTFQGNTMVKGNTMVQGNVTFQGDTMIQGILEFDKEFVLKKESIVMNCNENECNFNIDLYGKGNIGSIDRKWNSIFVENIVGSSMKLKECKMNTLQLNTLSSNFITCTDTTVKDLLVENNARFNGILQVSKLQTIKVGDPIVLQTASMHLSNKGSCLKINVENESCKVSTNNGASVVISPDNRDIMEITSNGSIIIGKGIPIDFILYGKMNVTKSVVIKENLDIGGILNVKRVQTDSLTSRQGSEWASIKDNCIKFYPKDLLKFASIDENCKFNCTSIDTVKVTTRELIAKQVQVSNLNVENTANVSKIYLKDTATFQIEQGDLLIDLKSTSFHLNSNGELKSNSISTGDLIVSAKATIQKLHVTHNIHLADSIELYKNHKNNTLEILNKRGDVNLFAAGNKGITVSATSGNVGLSGNLNINSGLDLYTTGSLDRYSASLLVKGGVSIFGSLYVAEKFIIGNTQFKTINTTTSTIEYTYTLPTNTPLDDDYVLACKRNGEMYWKKCCVVDNTIESKSEPVGGPIGEPVGEPIVPIVPVSDILYGKQIIGESRSSKIIVSITFEKEFTNTKYIINGNLVSSKSDLNDTFACTFKNLTKTGCTVIVKNLDNGYWDDKALTLHYSIVGK